LRSVNDNVVPKQTNDSAAVVALLTKNAGDRVYERETVASSY
jgi:hypothetical protein